MAFQDDINDYTLGATGTITVGSETVSYEVTNGANGLNDSNHGNNSAQVYANSSGTRDGVEVTFSQPIVGASVLFQGSDATESYFILVDGVIVDLEVLIANGDATLVNVGTGPDHIINDGTGAATAGTVSGGGTYTGGGIGQITFNIPVTSIGVIGDQGPSSGNYDGIEIGVDDATLNVVCYTNGTLIATDQGSRPVELLQVGDMVQTFGGEYKPIRWIGIRHFCKASLTSCDNLQPVRITAGALGRGLPERDLLVSRQHRILASSKVAERMFGKRNVLISAIKLTALPGIYVDDSVTEVTYVHMLFDAHEVIFAEGAPSESLHPGAEGIKAIPVAARDEILTIFPQLEEGGAETMYLVPSGKAQKQFVTRHVKNDKDLLELFQSHTR
ncbi:hypothetical protein DS901_13325 [Loktanella sp. D2R18]|uniref:Hint domain-containing protein n=1 Tax=Rhodobacterales TaxID=204455 RepID=UPI000DEA226F|nr:MULTISPECIES: Hint domain-containing protein [Rhodobacterales]MDO6591722.1 Hint domain-containing protein [Yoonia sp. 1_MG-2023]RBW42544.1 hypothetical protein DS901_13325 [Loktanella sp. D2R18]